MLLFTDEEILSRALESHIFYNSYIIRILLEYLSPYVQLNAARKLRDFPTTRVIAALYDAVCDIDYLVRNHASESLLFIHGLEPMISDHSEIFGLICTERDPEKNDTAEDAAHRYKRAENMLKSLFGKDE